MKRAIVTLGHPDHAGMLRALRILDEAAARHGWELRFVLSGHHPLVDAIGLPPERTTYLPAIRRWRSAAARLSLPLTVMRLARMARTADLFYACTLSSFPYCLLAGRLARVPQVTHVYSSYGDGGPYRKHLLGRARNVVAPSADSLELARRGVGAFAPGARARVVYNGMDVERIAREAAVPLPIGIAADGGAGPSVGMVGNLDTRKNPALLVEAAALVRERMPDVRVLLVGAFRDPAYEASVRARIAALGLERAVTVTGFLANPFPVVRTLDVLAHPALRDPFPLALLEGMALARPIVASAVGGIPEMLVDGESGLLVPPADAGALARALLELLQDRERRHRIGAGAYERLTTVFSLAGFAAGMFTAFDEAVAAGA
jgi:glycosyltransferase involved in cell wall biosynthesis